MKVSNERIFRETEVARLKRECDALETQIGRMHASGLRQSLRVKLDTKRVELRKAIWRETNEVARMAFNMPEA